MLKMWIVRAACLVFAAVLFAPSALGVARQAAMIVS